MYFCVFWFISVVFQFGVNSSSLLVPYCTTIAWNWAELDQDVVRQRDYFVRMMNDLPYLGEISGSGESLVAA
jgi:Ca2+/Na+ antiporter